MLALSVPSLQQNSQDTSNFYLANIYQQLNGSNPPIPSSLVNPIEPFSPTSSSVWVNCLWILSLVISLTCALLSTLLLRWARRYLKVAYPRYSPHKKARIRAFYKNGVEKLQFSWMIELLPTLLHISLFLFFAGLSVFLFSANRTIFKAVTAWIALCVILYACLTLLPIFRKDSPYTAPLSTSVSFCLTGIRYLFFRLLQRFPQIDPSIFMILRDPRGVQLTDFFSHSMSKTAEAFAFKMDPKIDYNSLLWTFDSLDEDEDLERFFERLPRLCDSKTGRDLDLQQGFIRLHKKRLSSALIGLMNRTLPHNLVAESVRQHRMIICTKVVNSTSLLGPWWILRCVLLGEWSRFLECIEFGLFVQNWKNITDKVTTFYAQCVAALTISILRDRIRDGRWFQLAGGLLKVPKPVLYKYITHGDSILLANAIFIVRRTVQTYSGAKERHRQDILDASSKTLEKVCKLDIGGTLPELQHEFCDLWNQLVHTAKTDERAHHVYIAKMTLKNIRKLYIALHGSPGTPPAADCSTTDDPDAVSDHSEHYSMCTVGGHRPATSNPALQFDEPDPDAPPTPNIMPMPSPSFPFPSGQPSNFTTPHPSSSSPAPYLSVPSHYAFTPSHSPAASLDATMRFPEPHITRSHTLNGIHGGDVQSQQPSTPTRLPRGFASSVSSIHLDNDNVSTQRS